MERKQNIQSGELGVPGVIKRLGAERNRWHNKLLECLFFIAGIVLFIWFLRDTWIDNGSKFFSNIQSEDKKEITTLNESAPTYFDRGEYDKALAVSEQRIKLNENDVEAWVDKGMALFSMKNCAEATASLYHASMIETTDAELHSWAEDTLNSVMNECKTS